MIKREAGRFVIEGPITFASVRALLEAGRREMAACDGEVRVDLSRVTEADSTAVSLLLHWLRDARRGADRVMLSAVLGNLVGLLGQTSRGRIWLTTPTKTQT